MSQALQGLQAREHSTGDVTAQYLVHSIRDWSIMCLWHDNHSYDNVAVMQYYHV